jgi:hypothetical protein
VSRAKRRPPWPLRRFPGHGESVVHAACREWDLPCPCESCSTAPPVPPNEQDPPDDQDPLGELLDRLGIVRQPLPLPPDDAPVPPRPWSDTSWEAE